MKPNIKRVRAKAISASERKKLDAELKSLAALSTAALIARARPMNTLEKAHWDRARRGRPKKPAAEKSVRVLFTIDPSLLAKVDRYAKLHQLTRAELIANGLRKAISA